MWYDHVMKPRSEIWLVKIRPLISVLALALVSFLAACASDPGEQVAVEPLPVATALPASTSTPTALPSPTAEPVEATQPAPTATDRPTAAPAPADTPIPTATPAPVPVNLAELSLGLETVATGLDQPVYVTHAGDGSGRIFVLEKAGRIVALDGDGSNARTFLDISDRVGSGSSEQGLLGLAFAPNVTASGRFYVYYTDKNGDTVIARYAANADRSAADPASETILLAAPQPAANHNGGMIAFGPDGYLYAGLGDGGAANDRFGHGQNLATVLGTVIRIDVSGDGAVAPADNPFVGQEGARPEIWAYGLRNPWRFSFDRLTGELWIADVGQNQWEEVNVQPAGSAGGENYGWPIMEGTRCFQADTCDQSGLVLPVAEYGHDQGCSVTGGYVYRGAAAPGLYGVYLYGDYCSGRIWGFAADAAGQGQNALLLSSGRQISSFGETESGEVLLVDYSGAVYRLVDESD